MIKKRLRPQMISNLVFRFYCFIYLCSICFLDIYGLYRRFKWLNNALAVLF